MIASRYLAAVCALLALALVPTIIHSYSREPVATGPGVRALATELAGYRSVPTDRNPGWGRRRFDTDDWVERDYRASAGSTGVRLTVVRTFDAKSVYHHPELAVAYGTSFVGQEVVRLPSRPDIPVHVLRPAAGVNASAAYLLHYDTAFVADPIAFQIRSAGEMLFTRRKPMTLYFALETGSRRDSTRATDLLFAAVDALRSQ